MKKLADSTGNVNVTDKDCKDFYNKNIDRFKNPNQVRASHILISANPYEIQQELTKGSKEEINKDELKSKIQAKLDERKTLAEKLAKELKADSSKFAQYAKKYSNDPMSAKKGGDLGFFAKEQMVPEFSKVAFSLKPNTVSDVIQTQFGYHIVIVTDRREAGIAPYDKAQSQIKDFLTTQKQIRALDDLTIAAKKKAKVEFMDERYNPEVIQKKLSKQVDEATNGQASKIREKSKQK